MGSTMKRPAGSNTKSKKRASAPTSRPNRTRSKVDRKRWQKNEKEKKQWKALAIKEQMPTYGTPKEFAKKNFPKPNEGAEASSSSQPS